MSEIDDCLKSVERLTRDRGEAMRANDDKLAEIRKRHEFNSRATAAFHFPGTAWAAHDDRAWLLAEVERMRAKNEKLRAVLEMVRDADDDCRMDGLATIPAAARQSIDDALEAEP